MKTTRWILWMGTLGLLLLGFASEAMATAVTTRRPEVVNGACKKVADGTHTPRVYVSGQTEGMSSPPGGPTHRMTSPIEPGWLKIRRVGCKNVEPQAFVRDGKCKGLPRYRWKGKVQKGQAFEVLYGGFLLGKIGQQDPNAAPQCPGPPKPYDETSLQKGYPKKISVTFKTADIHTQPQGDGLLVTLPVEPLRKHLQQPYALSNLRRRVANTNREALLGKGDEVTFEVTITARIRRRELDSQKAVRCQEEILEKVWIELPGVPGAWQQESKNLWGRTPGPCPRPK